MGKLEKKTRVKPSWTKIVSDLYQVGTRDINNNPSKNRVRQNNLSMDFSFEEGQYKSVDEVVKATAVRPGRPATPQRSLALLQAAMSVRAQFTGAHLRQQDSRRHQWRPASHLWPSTLNG